MFNGRGFIAWGATSALFALALIVSSCGGGSMQSTNNNGNNSGTSPTPSSNNPGSSGSSSPYFIASLMSSADGSNRGQITLNSTGSGTVKLQSADASTAYSVQFCQFANGTSNCMALGSVTTDASGNLQSSFTFGKSGTWAGIFELKPSNSGTSFGSTFPTPSTADQYRNPLQKAADITGGLPAFWGTAGSDPLSSGVLTVSGSVAQITLTGAAPNSSYSVSFCGNGGGSSCYGDLGTVTTDGSGNGTGQANTNNFDPPGVFSLGRNNTVEFVTAVKVP